jgi:hypothetical protein
MTYITNEMIKKFSISYWSKMDLKTPFGPLYWNHEETLGDCYRQPLRHKTNVIEVKIESKGFFPKGGKVSIF